jgi:hypothetical protein
MRRLILFSAFGLLMLAASPAEAHVFKYFETVGVLLHMEPGDDPLAGEPGQLFFYFNDKAGKFEVGKCDCRVRITEGDKVIYDEPLTGEAKAYGDDVRLVNFTFPRRDIYKVELSARESDYPPFKLSYDVRIDRQSEHPAPEKEDSDMLWVWVGGGAIIMGMVLGYFFRRPAAH